MRATMGGNLINYPDDVGVPTVFEMLFFEKVVRLIQYTCDCDPEYSVEAFDWDWASFNKNILLPNRNASPLRLSMNSTGPYGA